VALSPLLGAPAPLFMSLVFVLRSPKEAPGGDGDFRSSAVAGILTVSLAVRGCGGGGGLGGCFFGVGGGGGGGWGGVLVGGGGFWGWLWGFGVRLRFIRSRLAVDSSRNSR